jgi:plastocyanin
MIRSLLAAVLAAAVLSVLAAQALAATRTVSLGDDWFVRKGDPTTVTVKRGTTVRWRWVGRDLHNVVANAGPEKFHSSLKEDGTYSKRVTRPGRYTIVCSVHQPDMRMTLRVTR